MAFNDNISGTSDDLDGSGSGFDGTFSSSQYPLDDRARLEQKIEKIREKMTHNSIAHERDLEEYLRITGGLETRQDNPQTMRIRQHFEKKNKKYSQELAQLQVYPLDDRARLEQKIEKIREKMTHNSIAHERDLEEYLRITGGLETRQDNPQTMRIRQHFEKKNKKYSQELAQLQKKLVETEKRLEDLDKGVSLNSANTSSHSMLQNVSHGIKKTGSNLKEMTGNVIAAPFDIAYKVKKNMFGSADNLPKSVDDMGQSTFYVHSPQTISNSDRIRSSTLPHNMTGIPDRIPEPTSPTPIIKVDRPPNEYRGQHEKIKQFGTEIETLRQRNSLLEKMLADHRSETKAEILAYRNELSESRFKIQQLEQTLNETMEVHQNEVKQLKSDLNLIGTRMDYQYNDRFKRIEEAVESSNNRVSASSRTTEAATIDISESMAEDSSYSNRPLQDQNMMIQVMESSRTASVFSTFESAVTGKKLFIFFTSLEPPNLNSP
uniref:Uncharacterized protein n=1 Tax=Acrobeloides nanus TaxID=290746 RepID=A0A914D1K9_9BILA